MGMAVLTRGGPDCTDDTFGVHASHDFIQNRSADIIEESALG